MGFLKPLEHKFKAMIFSLLKMFLKKGAMECIPIDGNKVKKVLFLRPDKLGDMIIAFPVFDALKRNFPHIKISLLASPRTNVIIENDSRFSKIYMYLKNPLKDLKTIREIRKAKYDCIVDLVREDSVTTLFLSQFACLGKPRIGLAKIKFDEYYDFNDPFNLENKDHIIDNTLKLLKAFGVDSSKESGYAPPYVSTEELDFAQTNIQALRDSDKTKIIGYNLSAGGPTRIWAKEKSLELVKRITGLNENYKVLLFTMPDERNRATVIQDAIKTHVEIIPDNLNFTSVAGFIKFLDLLITPDTSVVHIARSFHIPVIGFYPDSFKNNILWNPYEQKIGAVVSNNFDNIFDITVDQVVDTFKSVAELRKLVSK